MRSVRRASDWRTGETETGLLGSDGAGTGSNSPLPRNPDEEKLWPEPLLQFNPEFGLQQQAAPQNIELRHLAKPPDREHIHRRNVRTVGDATKRSRYSSVRRPRACELAAAIDAGVDVDAGAYALMLHPVGAWLEIAVAFEECDGHFVLAATRRVAELGSLLARAADRTPERCTDFLLAFLRWISAVKRLMQGASKAHALPQFEPHHYIAITGAVFTTLQPGTSPVRDLATAGTNEGHEDRMPIFRVAFSRARGDPFLCVSRHGDRLQPRDFRQHSAAEDAATDGYLVTDEEIWNPDDDHDLLPRTRMRQTEHGPQPKAKYQSYLPSRVTYDGYGHCSDGDALPFSAWFVRTPLLLDPTSPFF
jgi:hypothetical protein